MPGPEIRVRQGDRLRVSVENRLDEETTVHWHGLRVPNAMDGVPHLTQKPVAPGKTFMPQGSPGMTGTKRAPFTIYEFGAGRPKVYGVE